MTCVCGQRAPLPLVVPTGVLPDAETAERARYRAFRAAGLVRNYGGNALALVALGVLFFPFAFLGAAIGVYALVGQKGPLRRYSGPRAALLAVVLGLSVGGGEAALAISWLSQHQAHRMAQWQATAAEDLRGLLRAQRLYRAVEGTYATFKDFRFHPTYGRYTIYLTPSDRREGTHQGAPDPQPLPLGSEPHVAAATFLAVAVANLDGDPGLDVWHLDHNGDIQHIQDDAQD